MIISMSFVIASTTQQLFVSFDDALRPSVQGSCLAFLTVTPYFSEKESINLLNFIKNFLYEYPRNKLFRDLFSEEYATKLTMECWEAWISLINNGDIFALSTLSLALNNGMYGLHSEPEIAKKLSEEKNRKVKNITNDLQEQSIFIHSAHIPSIQQEYSFDRITPNGLTYLKKVVKIEKYFPDSIAKIMQKIPGMENKRNLNYTPETKKIAEEWLLKAHPLIRNAIVGKFKSLKEYYPGIFSTSIRHGEIDDPKDLSKQAPIDLAHKDEDGSESSYSSGSIEEIQPLLEANLQKQPQQRRQRKNIGHKDVEAQQSEDKKHQ